MSTLEMIVKDLQRVPPERLEEVSRLVQSLLPPPEPLDDEGIIQRMRSVQEAFVEWSEEDWADFDAELRRTRAALFNRPTPEF